MWHREAGGTFCEDDRDRVPSAMPSCQCLFYLTDCTPETHCFSVGRRHRPTLTYSPWLSVHGDKTSPPLLTVPESLEAKRALPVRRTDDDRFIVGDYHPEDMWYTRHRHDGIDVHAPAGSVVIQVRPERFRPLDPCNPTAEL